MGNLLKRVVRYVRYDIKEIIFPSSIPNPRDYVPPPPIPLTERWKIFTAACRRYVDSWDSEKLNAELRRRRGEQEEDPNAKDETIEELKLLADEFKGVTKDGAHTLWPHLQHLYKTRVRAYKEAVEQFIEGYKEGFQEAHELEGKEIEETDPKKAKKAETVESAAVDNSPVAADEPPPKRKRRRKSSSSED